MPEWGWWALISGTEFAALTLSRFPKSATEIHVRAPTQLRAPASCRCCALSTRTSFLNVSSYLPERFLHKSLTQTMALLAIPFAAANACVQVHFWVDFAYRAIKIFSRGMKIFCGPFYRFPGWLPRAKETDPMLFSYLCTSQVSFGQCFLLASVRSPAHTSSSQGAFISSYWDSPCKWIISSLEAAWVSQTGPASGRYWLRTGTNPQGCNQKEIHGITTYQLLTLLRRSKLIALPPIMNY